MTQKIIDSSQMIKYLFCGISLMVIVFFLSYLVVNYNSLWNITTDLRLITIATGQLQQSTTPGVKVTTPTTDQRVSFPNNDDSKGLQLMGTSTDTIDTDCQVSIIANDIKPYQNTTATGPGGNKDYSTWTYSLAPTLLKEGSNKVTARILCSSPNASESAGDTSQVKHSSAFFTVLNTSAPVAADNLSSSTTTSAATAANASSTGATTTATTGPGVRTGAVPYFVSNPTCQVEQLSHDLSCNIKIAGIENIDKIRPFLHADLTTSCINPAGNTPPDKVRTTPLIGDSKSILAVVEVNCPPSMTPSFVYKNVELQVGDVLLSVPGAFTSR
jgi:hypothetical protein